LSGFFVFKHMELDTIFRQSRNKLSSTERDLYFSFCSFADAEGFVLVRQKTVANRAGFDHSFASKIVKKLVEKGFLKRHKEVFLCVVGFQKSGTSDNFNGLTDNFCGQAPEKTDGLSDNFNGLTDNFNGTSDNSSLSYIENKKEREGETPAPSQFQSSVRNVRQTEPPSNLRTEDLANTEPVKILETMFNFQTGINFASILKETVTNADHWKQFLITKIAFADEPDQRRFAMQKWILTAYGEYCEKHPPPPPPRELTPVELEAIENQRIYEEMQKLPNETIVMEKSLREMVEELKAKREAALV
jgi:hypothetical protein